MTEPTTEAHTCAPAPAWKSMRFVPTNTSREIVLRFSDGREVVCHFAQDLSGEEQPPFRGWFVPNGRGTGYSEVETKGANGWKFADEG